jgi:hypothetical protein
VAIRSDSLVGLKEGETVNIVNSERLVEYSLGKIRSICATPASEVFTASYSNGPHLNRDDRV